MRNALSIGMVLCLSASIILFGAAGFEHATVVFVVAGLLGLLWAGKLVLAREVHWTRSPMHWPVLGFLVYAIIDYTGSPVEHASRIELFQVLLYGFVYFFVVQNLAHRQERTWLIGALLVLGSLQAMFGIWQAYSGAKTIFGYERPEGYLLRASGTYICPNHLAGLLEMLLGLALAKLAFQHGKGHGSIQQVALKKFLLGYAAVVIVAGILHSLSRGGWVATAAGILGFVIWATFRARSRWPRIALGVAIAGTFATMLFNVAAVRNYVALTFTENQPGASVSDPTLGGRTMYWQSTFKIIQENPLFGTGAGTWNYMQQKHRHPGMQMNPEYAHNDILQLMSDYGIFGFSLVLAALACFYWQATRIVRRGVTSEQRAFAIGAILAVSMMLIHSWFDFNLHIPANAMVFVALLGMVAGIEVPSSSAQRIEMQPAFRYAGAGALVLLAIGIAWQVVPAGISHRHVIVGTALKEQLRWDEAKEAFQQAIRWDSRFPEAYRKLGEVCRNQAQFRIAPDRAAERLELAREAVRCFETSLLLNPYQTDVILKLGSACELVGDVAKAKQAYERATVVDPQSARAYVAYGVFLRKQGQDQLASQVFEKSRQVTWWADRQAAITLEEVRLSEQGQ